MEISITEKAAHKVKQIAAKQGKNTAALRVKVTGGGCSGLSYQFAFADSIASEDSVFKKNEITVVVDSTSLQYIDGSQLDYEESLMKSGFKISNPNATSSCSCGESFSV